MRNNILSVDEITVERSVEDEMEFHFGMGFNHATENLMCKPTYAFQLIFQ